MFLSMNVCVGHNFVAEFSFLLQELKNMLEEVRKQDDTEVHPRDKKDDLLTIRIDLVTLHGEVILMESYSTLNYTGYPLEPDSQSL